MLKVLFKICLGFLVTSALAMLAVVMFVNLDHFKTALSERIQQQTGRECQIQGKLHWTLTPWLALKAEDITLKNASGFSEEFLHIQKLEVEPKFLALVTGKLFLQLRLEGVDLNLEKRSTALNNWSDLLARFSPAPLTRDSHSEQRLASQPKTKAPWFRVLLGGLILDEMNVNWKDPQQGQHLQFTHLHLKAFDLHKALLGQAIPLSLSLRLDNLQTQRSANLAFQTSLKVQLLEKSVQFDDSSLKLQLPSGTPMVLSGQIRIAHFDAQPGVIGSLKLSTLKVPELAGLFLPSVPEGWPKTISGKAKFEWKANLWQVSELLLHLDEGQVRLNGRLACAGSSLSQEACLRGEGQAHLQAQHLRIQNQPIPSLTAEASFKDGVLQMPYQLQIFESMHRGDLSLLFEENQLGLKISQMADDFDMTAFLKGLGQAPQLQGRGSLRTRFETRGDSWEVWQKNLSGQGELILEKGEWQGINLGYLLKHARASVKSLISSISVRSFSDFGQHVKDELQQWRQQSEQQKGVSTVFNSLKANFSLENQKISPSSLQVLGSDFQLRGQGSIDLAAKTLAYRLEALSLTPEEEKQNLKRFFNQMPLFISVNGAWANPSVRPELDAYLKSALSYARMPSREGEVTQEKQQPTTEETLSASGKPKVKALLMQWLKGA